MRIRASYVKRTPGVSCSGTQERAWISLTHTTGICGDSLIDGVVIKGSGTNPAYSWHQGLELNDVTNMTVRNTTIYRTAGTTLNLQCEQAQCGWTFTDCNFDMSTGSVTREPGKSIILTTGMNGAVFTRCTFTPATVDWGLAWLESSSNNDFRTCTILGAGAHTQVGQDGASTGNLLPQAQLPER